METMEESRHGSNPQHQPSRPNSSRFQCSRFLSSHFYPFVGSNFSPPLCPPLSSLCHLVQLHRKKKASNALPPTAPAAWQWLQGMSRCAADQTGATSRPLHPRTSSWFKKAATASRHVPPALPVMGRSKLIEDRVTSTLLTHSQDSITSSAKTKTQDSPLECYRWCVIKSW